MSSTTSKRQGSRSRPLLSRIRQERLLSYSRYPPCDSSKQTGTSKSPSLHPTGNRWQVASPDDPERRPHRTVHKTWPRAQNLRVSREAAANPAPEDQRLIVPQAIGVAHLSDNHGVRRSPPLSSPHLLSPVSCHFTKTPPATVAAPQWDLNAVCFICCRDPLSPPRPRTKTCTMSPRSCLRSLGCFSGCCWRVVFLMFYLKKKGGDTDRVMTCVYVHKCLHM